MHVICLGAEYAGSRSLQQTVLLVLLSWAGWQQRKQRCGGVRRTSCLTFPIILLSNTVWIQRAGGIMQTTEVFVLSPSHSFYVS